MEDLLESLVWALPMLVVAAVFYGIAMWKKGKGKGLYAEAKELLAFGNRPEARDRFLQALWKANEEPRLERDILEDLARLYEKAGVVFRGDDYRILIRQYEELARKGSQKALAELKKVQALKKELIAGMPQVT